MIPSILIRLASISLLVFIRMSNSENNAGSKYYEESFLFEKNDDTSNPTKNNLDMISSNKMSETLAKVNDKK